MMKSTKVPAAENEWIKYHVPSVEVKAVQGMAGGEGEINYVKIDIFCEYV